MILTTEHFGADTCGANTDGWSSESPVIPPERPRANSASDSVKSAPDFDSARRDARLAELPNFVGDPEHARSMCGQPPADNSPVTAAAVYSVRADRTQIDQSATDNEVGPVTLAQMETAQYRLKCIETFAALKKLGQSNEEAARQIGEPFITLYKWRKNFIRGGFDALLPNQHKCGRPRKLAFTPEEAKAVKAHINPGQSPVSNRLPHQTAENPAVLNYVLYVGAGAPGYSGNIEASGTLPIFYGTS